MWPAAHGLGMLRSCSLGRTSSASRRPRALVGTKRDKLGKGNDEITLVVLRSNKNGKAAQLVMSESGDADLLTDA